MDLGLHGSQPLLEGRELIDAAVRGEVLIVQTRLLVGEPPTRCSETLGVGLDQLGDVSRANHVCRFGESAEADDRAATVLQGPLLQGTLTENIDSGVGRSADQDSGGRVLGELVLERSDDQVGLPRTRRSAVSQRTQQT